jgi:type III restriction enzyme
MGKISSNRMEDLRRTCAPALADLVKEQEEVQLSLPFGETPDVTVSAMDKFISQKDLESMPSRYRKAVEHAVTLYQFTEKKKDMSFAPVFTSLLGPLDEAAKGLILDLLLPDVPASSIEQASYFDPYYGNLSKKDVNWLKNQANNLKRTLIYRNGVMPLGLLSFCLAYGNQGEHPPGGVFASVRQKFADFRDPGFQRMIEDIRDFRNTYVAHQEKDLTDREKAQAALKRWVGGLLHIYRLHHGASIVTKA